MASYDGNKVARVKDLKNAAGQNKNLTDNLNNRTEILTYNNAVSHNSYGRTKNLGTAITAAQVAAIRDGTFADLYPGDNWTLTIDGTGHNVIVLGFNIMRVAGEGNGARRNHAAVRLSAITRQINTTATCAGHIMNSELYKTTFPAFLTKLEAVVGAGNIVPFTDHVADSIDDDGNVNHRTTVADCKLFMASYMNITGNNRNMANMGWEVAGQIQLPYYRHNNGAYSGRTSENMNATRWYSIINSERILSNYAPQTESYAACAVYPIFLLG